MSLVYFDRFYFPSFQISSSVCETPPDFDIYIYTPPSEVNIDEVQEMPTQCNTDEFHISSTSEIDIKVKNDFLANSFDGSTNNVENYESGSPSVREMEMNTYIINM